MDCSRRAWFPLAFAGLAWTQEENPDIQSVIDAFARAESAPRKLSGILAADVEFWSSSGRVARGREDFIARLRDAFLAGFHAPEVWSEQSPAIYRVSAIRRIGADVAIAHATRSVYGSTIHHSAQSVFVLKKEQAGWQIVSYLWFGPGRP